MLTGNSHFLFFSSITAKKDKIKQFRCQFRQKSKCSIDGGKIIGKPVTARFSKIRFDFNPIQGYPVGGNNSLGSRMLLNLWLLRVQQKTPTDRVRVQSGAGGSRTRVQTWGHILSTCLSLLDFRGPSAAEQPNDPLFPVFLTFGAGKSSG